MSWNDERVEILRQLWTEGLSASQIAERLGGGLSRNAVIGKVHRLKLESRARSAATGVAEAQADEAVETAVEVVAQESAEIRLVSSQVVAMRALPRTLGATALKMEPIDTDMDDDASPSALAIFEEPRRSGEVVPIARKLTLVQLSERTCKWPVGDPLKPDFHFCGNHAGDASPYCAYHARLAFQPSAERRRVR